MDLFDDAVPQHAGRKLKTAGVMPARQVRSKATFRALVDAGLELSEKRDFSEITIGDLCTNARVSVGAFYERFSSKEVFLTALQEIAVEKIEANVRLLIRGAAFQRLSAQEAIRRIVKTWLAGICDHRGMIKGSLRYLPIHPDAWFPFRRLGQYMSGVYVEVLAPYFEGNPEYDIRIAIQFVHGVIVNSILNNPGPLRLEDPAMEANIRRTIFLFLALKPEVPVWKRRK